ncbi:flagellar basal-body MS-ring/collar protein FliF [Bacillus sp. PS06]|uniref:flagellar basal-body MS-ring/collar protein FliF n=1 Tax=Bacillus sp. PS06 TaxID=2764176 RepID=UPI001786247B|nr:flagellar basal-body MS-ring/collar protein FliF [Bacillus sp. PS06]MBD8068302.1 flagellar M-ring protein FliF [Bacillus sp. PS06]
MNEKLNQYTTKLKTFWSERSKTQKLVMVGSVLLLITLIVVFALLGSRQSLVPLYSNLSPQETGQIKATLDSRGIQSEIADNGSTIRVPEQMVDTLKVELAAEGVPDTGTIDYGFFGQNAGFGMTDNEFNVLKLEAMQTEIASLIKGIDGINDAKVMITIPETSVFLNDVQNSASASIVLNTRPGYQFDQQQINALYHLVSKSVPNLPTDNIVITNQNFEYFDIENNQNSSNLGNVASQLELKREIERDIQKQVQQMLGTMIGQDKVIVSVTADLDFTQENREENLVVPVDNENMEGLDISVERITESYTGNGADAAGVTGVGEDDVANYPAGTADGNGDYERIEERINKDVNRIRKEIVEAPYKIRDLGIQVMVEPPDPTNVQSLSAQSVEDITKILSTIVRTTVNKDDASVALTDEELQDKVVVSVQQFNGKPQFEETGINSNQLPMWIYIVGGALVLIVLILLIIVFRRKSKVDEEEYIEEVSQQRPIFSSEVADLTAEQETEASTRRKQLEKMAKEKPEDFAKLLKSWLSEE